MDHVKQKKITLFWFRRDLRLIDNKGLYNALIASDKVLPLFIFDEDIINQLPENDHRITFIYDAVAALYNDLKDSGSDMIIRKGKPFRVISELLQTWEIEAVYCNADHEPYGIQRDETIKELLASQGIPFHTFLDHLVFDRNAILKADGTPYVVFTPYSKQWKNLLTDGHLNHYPSEKHLTNFLKFVSSESFPKLSEVGFLRSDLLPPDNYINETLIRQYDRYRDYPGSHGTSRLGVHLRFGTISIRALVANARQWNHVFLNELIWREFYAMILWHYPRVTNMSFKPEYDRIAWVNDEGQFDAWKMGNTGYPMVDAGMRQLNESGFMHNRLRMVTASFLTKHLLIDWRWGEAYFAEKLFDYELSSNNGGWQWSAGTGCDAAPYFRIFNPYEQQRKFDPDSHFVKAWVPELDTKEYFEPVVDHKMARERCLSVYKKALSA